MKKNCLLVSLIGVFLLILAVGSFARTNKIKSWAMDNNPDPRIYMPLAIGNTWVYEWRNQAVSELKENTDDILPTWYAVLFYEQPESFSLSNLAVFVYEKSVRQEIYQIYRQDMTHYFFSIKTNDPEATIRDGRYSRSLENAWTWTDTPDEEKLNIVLTETIKREYLEPGKKVKDLYLAPKDNRNLIHVIKENGKWNISKMKMEYTGGFGYEYDFSDHLVKVKAGQFSNCIKLTEFYEAEIGKKMVNWQIESFWAPHVGKVKEVYYLPGKKTAYTMELEKYELKK